MFDGAVYLVADGFIYITECERLSVDGVQSAIDQMIRFQKQRRRVVPQQQLRFAGGVGGP